MCDYFSKRMDDEDHGDLTDIVRTGGHLSNVGLEPFLDDDASWQVEQLLPNCDPFADLQGSLLNPYVAAGGGATRVDHGGFGDRFQLLPPPPPPPPPKAVAAAAAATATTSSILSKVHQISLSPLLPRLISAGCPMVGAADRGGEVQISPHRATPGNKRRY